MKMNKFYMPTLREDPQDVEIASHKPLLRAGMIRKAAAGLYSYLPLGYRIVRKVENIVHEEVDNYGSQEIHMPVAQPREIWEESGRWKTFRSEMSKLKDRNSHELCLRLTAEEYFTDLVKGEIKSYKQLPLNIYQIQTKYRDEKRPRFGINRSRGFLMRDTYTFDVNEGAMGEAYTNMWKAYEAVFNRLGLEYKIVAGNNGAMGGNSSHEFIALSDVGEGVVCYSDDSDLAATDEKAYMRYQVNDESVEKLSSEKVLTPNCKTVEEVSDFLNVDVAYCLKAVGLMVEGKPVIVFIPGDHELNMSKLVSYLKCPGHEIEMMGEQDILALNSSPGFTGPIGLDCRIMIDSGVKQMKNFVVGASEENHHTKNVNYGDDFEGEIVEDLLMVQEGDIDPETKSPLKFKRGIEVGNIFQLGQKYSKSMNATSLDENGKEQFFWMGSYGIDVTRSVSAIVEQNHDDKGMIWPLVVAPYHVIITIVNTKDEEQNTLTEKLYEKLLLQRVEVLLDDRKERVGVKFNDRDLIGIPLRITISKKATEDIAEFSERRTPGNVRMSSTETYEKVVEIISSNLRSVGGLYR